MSAFIYIDCTDNSSIPELIDKWHLDRRFKYTVYADRLTITVWATLECAGCDGIGCFECGYTGKTRRCFPCDIPKTNVLKKYR